VSQYEAAHEADLRSEFSCTFVVRSAAQGGNAAQILPTDKRPIGLTAHIAPVVRHLVDCV